MDEGLEPDLRVRPWNRYTKVERFLCSEWWRAPRLRCSTAISCRDVWLNSTIVAVRPISPCEWLDGQELSDDDSWLEKDRRRRKAKSRFFVESGAGGSDCQHVTKVSFETIPWCSRSSGGSNVHSLTACIVYVQGSRQRSFFSLYSEISPLSILPGRAFHGTVSCS